jgi:hypothetical protein
VVQKEVVAVVKVVVEEDSLAVQLEVHVPASLRASDAASVAKRSRSLSAPIAELRTILMRKREAQSMSIALTATTNSNSNQTREVVSSSLKQLVVHQLSWAAQVLLAAHPALLAAQLLAAAQLLVAVKAKVVKFLSVLMWLVTSQPLVVVSHRWVVRLLWT